MVRKDVRGHFVPDSDLNQQESPLNNDLPQNPNRRPVSRHPLPPSRGGNPFQGIPMPIPVEGWNLRASEIFRERPLSSHLERNAGWLQGRSRTSDAIEAALFPEYSLGGMEHEEVRSALNCALYDAGYTPSSEDTGNPTWTWTEGN